MGEAVAIAKDAYVLRAWDVYEREGDMIAQGMGGAI